MAQGLETNGGKGLCLVNFVSFYMNVESILKKVMLQHMFGMRMNLKHKWVKMVGGGCRHEQAQGVFMPSFGRSGSGC